MDRAAPTAFVFVLTLLLATGAVAQGPPKRTAYESKCGSEIAWMHDFSAAAEAAKRTGKPIFWFVPTGFGTPMDRIQEIYWYMMGGAFMDEDLIAFINARFIALDLGFKPPIPGSRGEPKADRAALKELSERYGLVRMKFIEPGIAILDSNAALVHLMDRLTTHNSRYMLDRLVKVLKAHSEIDVPLAAGTADSERAAAALARGEWAKARELALPAAAAGSAEACLVVRRAEALSGAPAAQFKDVDSPALALFKARRRLGSGAIEDAAGEFAALNKEHGSSPVGLEARYFFGVCRHLLRGTDVGDAAWKAVAATDQRWGWKAKIELERWGPFIHGFEDYRDYPADVLERDPLTGTTDPGTEERLDSMKRRAVDVLLGLQRQDGGWDDSRYDFGGLDSMPNVHVAVTALAAWALLENRAVATQRIDAALLPADAYLRDEKRTNPDDRDELSWAHVYRLLYWSRLRQDRPNDAGLKTRMQEVVRLLENFQQKSGAWRHEYDNPFTTASVLHALAVAESAGLNVDKKRRDVGAEALERCRGDNGGFTYGQDRGARKDTPYEAAAGRMPLCELALLLNKRSNMEKLGQALDVSFKFHDRIGDVRKYDNHADQFANGGFFFWYDMLGRALAIESFQGAARDEYRRKLRQTVLDIHEADGSWIDSHELGKTYGTAMGLIVLRLTEGPGH